MIADEIQLKLTKDFIIKFKEDKERLQKDPPPNTHPMILKAMLGGVESMIEELEDEVAQYEARTKPV